MISEGKDRLQYLTARRLGSLSALVCVLLVGCSKAQRPVPVSGRVTVQGAPVEDVIVTFTPCGDSLNLGIGSFGRTDADGRYRLNVAGAGTKGALVGKHRVTLILRDRTASKMTEEELASAVAAGKFRDGGLPSRARDGSIEFVVGPRGTDHANFDF